MKEGVRRLLLHTEAFHVLEPRSPIVPGATAGVLQLTRPRSRCLAARLHQHRRAHIDSHLDGTRLSTFRIGHIGKRIFFFGNRGSRQGERDPILSRRIAGSGQADLDVAMAG